VDTSLTCPKCGAEIGEHALTAADGTPLGFAGGGDSGALISLVCPDCGYAELRAGGPAAAASDALGLDTRSPAVGADSNEDVGRYLGQIQAALNSPAHMRGAGPAQPGVGTLVFAAVCAAVMSAGVVWLWQASGPVMEAGGFVARGGPYVIAHQAEDWIWLPTVGATLMVWAAVADILVAQHFSRPSLMLVFWTALFGLLAVPFFTHGFNAPGGGRSWAWISLGVLFTLMALPAALLSLMPSMWRGFGGAWGWAHLIGVVGGVLGGLWVWSVVA